ncbi:MAG: class I SAM-dependent methyltransferase [Nanoarchaeota archaeon]|nr:class I SAM-dependent methyltransferase [Nanoarchaeota archaeon]MBU1501774.1 class I SAM-dependent methyltransferase [Nanoarchaeota archaeon]MBU2458884.1 class I SAM-dependent methyltransferase [Nanoarchaeota archaeon]
MRTFQIPNLKEILKPRWAHKPGFGMSKRFVLHKRESFQQSTAPEDKMLLKKLGIKKGEKVLAVAGYYASWASEIARLGAKVDYSDISKEMVAWSKKEYGKLFKKYICSNYELVPKKQNEYDWTFTFEACGGGSGLPIAFLRSLLNKKGGILVYSFRYGKSKANMGNKPRTYLQIVKTLSKIYKTKCEIKNFNIKSHRFEKPTMMIKHRIHTIKTNKKARELAKSDLLALTKNKFSKNNLERLNALAEILEDDYVKEYRLK